MPKRFIIVGFTTFLFSVFINFSYANKPVANNKDTHQLTLYIMPTMHPLNWESPAMLYKSMVDCYLKTFFLKDNYLLGHLAVRIKTPLLDKTKIIAMTSGDQKEKMRLIFEEKIGFGVLGAPWKGRLEPEEELNHKLSVYAKRKKLAFITYNLHEKAMKKILDFMDHYSKNSNGIYTASGFYGGAFWPLYHNEGAGCSAYGAAMLELAGLLTPETKDWVMIRNVPMNLVGGEYNNGNRVRFKDMLKAKKWQENGELNKDFVEYLVFEPSVMFDWIHKERNSDVLPEYTRVDEDGLPGLLYEASHILPPEKPMFTSRPVKNVFVEKFLIKQKVIGSL